MDARIVTGDCLDVLRGMPDASVDAICTDPPYDLTSGMRGGSGVASLNLNSPAGRARIGTGGFMGASWDATGIAFDPETWSEALRVLKPGGHLVAFGGTRTSHRMVCAIEDAGFEIRDSLVWMYGSGFPKSLDVSKALDKAADAEREVVGQKGGRHAYGYDPKMISNFATGESFRWGDKHFTWDELPPQAHDYLRQAALRIGNITAPATDAARQWEGWGTALKPSNEPVCWATKPLPDASIDVNLLSALEDALCPRDTTSEAAMSASQSAAESTSLNIVRSWRRIWDDACELMSTSTIATASSLTTDLRTWNFCLSQITPDDIRRAASSPDGASASVLHADQLSSVVESKSSAIRILSVPVLATSPEPTSPQDAAARPAHEPICLARKPFPGTVASNIMAHGTGALNIDKCRIAGIVTAHTTPGNAKPVNVYGEYSGEWSGSSNPHPDSIRHNASGRWPANVILSHAPDCVEVGTRRVRGSNKPGPAQVGDEKAGSVYGDFVGDGHRAYHADADGMETVTVWECAPECAVAELDAQSGASASQRSTRKKAGKSVGNGITLQRFQMNEDNVGGYGDTGGASRFFYNAPIDAEDWDGARFRYQAKASRSERSAGLGSTCTVKYNVSGGATLCAETVRLLAKATSDIPTVRWLTGESGASITALCPQDSLSTTLTAIRRTTTSPIWSLLTLLRINASTQAVNSETANGGSLVEPVESSSRQVLTSTSAETASPPSASLVAFDVLSMISSDDAWQPRTNIHSTVKPVALMAWLCRLVTPPGGLVLDPFTGSGSTGVACVREGFRFVGIEQDADYAAIAEARIAHAEAVRDCSAPVETKAMRTRSTGVYAGGKGRRNIPRCPDHDQSLDIRQNNQFYKCGCRVRYQSYEEAAARQTAPLPDLPLFATVAD